MHVPAGVYRPEFDTARELGLPVTIHACGPPHAAGLDGARCLGLDAVTGSLTPGKRADLIVVSPAGPNLGVLTDPVQLLVTAAQPGNVDTVIADGRVLKQGGALTTLDAERVGADARQALAGVIARSRSATR